MIGENKEYTIKLIPQDGGTVHSVKLPASLLKYGLASLGVGAMLLVGAFSYAVYSMFHAQSDASEMEELRQVNSIQQEQLLQLAKRQMPCRTRWSSSSRPRMKSAACRALRLQRI